jgi:CheY-like chemotaxis protein
VAFPQSGYAVVSVTDTGAGMSEDQLSELFRDGVQFNVNNLQAGQGSGLGLYTAKGIIDQHGGTLTAASPGLGRGTTFTMTLPLYHVPDTALTSDLDHLKLSISTPTPTMKSAECRGCEQTDHCSKHLRILVVDDVTVNRRLLTRLLVNRGHCCVEAKDGREAVDQVAIAMGEGNPYDTILLDYEMPVMNGPTAATQIRNLGCDSCIVGKRVIYCQRTSQNSKEVGQMMFCPNH